MLTVAGVIFTFASSARAEPSVLLIVQGGIDQDPAPCELRLRSELAAEGLEVVTASGRTTQNLIDLEGLARRTGAVAGLSVLVDVQSIDGRLWVTDPSSHVDLVRTLHVSRTESDPVSVFALRAVEALRGARLELEQQKRKLSGVTSGATDSTTSAGGTTGVAATTGSTSRAADVAPVPQKPKRAKPKEDQKSGENKEKRLQGAASKAKELSGRWLVRLHGVFGWELNGVGTVVGAGADVSYWLGNKFAVGLGFDGPLFSRLTPRTGSHVHVNQELLTAQFRWSAITTGLGSLELVGVTGASRFAVSGDAPEPNYGVSNHGFEWLFGAGFGIAVPLSRRIRISLDGQWLRRVPAPVIIDGQNNKTRRLTGDTDSLLLGKLGFGVLF